MAASQVVPRGVYEKESVVRGHHIYKTVWIWNAKVVKNRAAYCGVSRRIVAYCGVYLNVAACI